MNAQVSWMTDNCNGSKKNNNSMFVKFNIYYWIGIAIVSLDVVFLIPLQTQFFEGVCRNHYPSVHISCKCNSSLKKMNVVEYGSFRYLCPPQNCGWALRFELLHRYVRPEILCVQFLLHPLMDFVHTHTHWPTGHEDDHNDCTLQCCKFYMSYGTFC